jgi:hypothetical protein
MAIFKASYTRTAAVAKGNIRYIENRPGKDGEKIIRTLYTWDGKIDRRDAYDMIDAAEKGSYFFRLVISPDPVKEDTHRDIYLRTVLEQTMRGLEDQLGTQIQWIAANHQDHAPQRHMHVLAILPRKLSRQDLFAGRSLATEAALTQRREQDKIREQQQERGMEWERQRS